MYQILSHRDRAIWDKVGTWMTEAGTVFVGTRPLTEGRPGLLIYLPWSV